MDKSKRKECFNCDMEIEKEGDAFCFACDPFYALDDDGEILTIDEWVEKYEVGENYG